MRNFQTPLTMQFPNMLFFALVITAVLYQARCQSFTLHPVSRTVHEGTDVTLICWSDFMTASNSESCTQPRLRWMKSTESGGVERIVDCYNVEETFNYRMMVELDERNTKYRLTMFNVQPQDSREYFCRMYFPRYYNPTTYDSDRATLRVNRSPHTPTCQVQPQHFWVGAIVLLKCTLSPHDPPSLLTWLDSTQNQLQNSLMTQPGGVFSALRVLQESDNMKNFTCVAGLDLVNGPRCSVRPLNIPINVTVSPSSQTVFEGETAVFMCHLTAIPSATPTEYVWFVNKGDQTSVRVEQTTLANQRGLYSLSPNAETLEILQVSAVEFNNSKISCSAFLSQQSYRGVASLMVQRVPVTAAGQAVTMTTSINDDISDKTSQKMSLGLIIGAIVGVILLVIIISLLTLYLIRNARKDRRPQREEGRSVQESSSQERVAGSLALAETNPTYENLPEDTRGQPGPSTDLTLVDSSEPQGDLYAIPNRRGGDIRHFTMMPQTNKATTQPGFVSLPRNLEPPSSARLKDPESAGMVYAKLNKDIRKPPKPIPEWHAPESSTSASDVASATVMLQDRGSQEEELRYADLHLNSSTHEEAAGVDALYAKVNKGNTQKASTHEI